MHYVLDAGFFVVTRNYYPDTFPTFWQRMEQAVDSEIISSVREVRKELENYGGEQAYLLEWMKTYKHIFTQPTPEEQNSLREMFLRSDYRGLVDEKKILKGGDVADPFVIAKARVLKASVVTNEGPAKRDKNGNMQGSLKIPDVCQQFDVPCLSPKEFMSQEGWKF